MDYFKSLDWNELCYTPFYCEENIWKLCERIEREQPNLIDFCHVVFISNHDEQVPLWAQKLGNPEYEFLAVWDYHVILVYNHDGISLVFDFDTIEQFPCLFDCYLRQVFREKKTQNNQKNKYLFRIVNAKQYLQTFASDRSRMIINGEYIKPPPPYPCIKTAENQNNLNSFISMTLDGFNVGKVITFEEFEKMKT